jgi:titin
MSTDVAAAPTQLIATPSDGSVTLTWSAPTFTGGLPIIGYRIEVSNPTTSGGTITYPGSVFLPNTGSTATSYLVSGLNNNNIYGFRVSAITGAGVSTNSTTVSSSPIALSGAPSNLVVTSANGLLALTWSAPSAAMRNGTTTVGYQVEITTAGSAFPATPLSSLTNLTSYTINGLQNGTTYQVRVTTVTDTGLGNAVIATAIPAGPASAPSGLTYTYDPTTANVSLRWTPPTDTGGLPITGWALNFCRVDAIAANSCVGTTANTTVLVANTFSSSTNYTIPGLTFGGFGATMQYGVAPITSAGTGAFAFTTVVQTRFILQNA